MTNSGYLKYVEQKDEKSSKEYLQAVIDRQKAEIDRLTKYNTDVAYKHYNDGVKDFAKRIISYIDVGHLCSPTMLRWSDLSVKEMVEQLAEEMVGADNG